MKHFSYIDIIDISSSTPLCVLEEISRSHSINDINLKSNNIFMINDCVQSIKNRIKPVIFNNDYLNFTNDDKKRLVNYINPKHEWDDISLYEAYDVIKYYFGEIHIPKKRIKYGKQSPLHPKRMNCCFLYRLCQYYNIPCNRNTNIAQMANAINMKIIPIEESINFLKTYINKLNKTNISIAYMKLTELSHNDALIKLSDVNNDYNYHQDLEISAKLFKNTKILQKRIDPKTPGEAVVLSAINYNKDISSSRDKIKEYLILRECETFCKKWKPYDINMKSKLMFDESIFDLDKNFNPYLPNEVYNKDILKQLAIQEGYSLKDINEEDPHSLLAAAFLSETFYHGKLLSIKKSKTLITLTPINEVNNEDIICYGIKNEHVVVFTFEELLDYFEKTKSYKLPHKKANFSKISIRKLKIICNKITVIGNMEQREKLSKMIDIVDIFQNKSNEKIKELYELYNNISQSEKSIIIECLELLFKLALCCRGWLKDTDDYPIENAPVLNQGDVDIRVTYAIINFENYCKDHEKIGNVILSLPTLTYNRLDDSWSILSANDEIWTVQKRLNDLKLGEEHHEVHSCMRLTSNTFCQSVWRYWDILSLPKKFNINTLKSIS